VTEPARFYLKYGSLGTDSVDETFATAGKALEIFEPESDVPKFSDSNTNIVTNSDGFSILSLGTGRLFSDDKTSYFGETDFGYLRVMLYGGIFYLILFYLPSFLIVGFSLFDRELKDFRLLFLSVLLVQMICNLKGMFEISGFLLLIFTALTMRDNSEA
jgi:hypothetical protein